MKRSIFSRTTLVTLLGLGLVLAIPIGSASASKQALAKLKYVNSFFGGTTFAPQIGFGGVTVNTTTTPTPTIMWPAGVVNCTGGTGCSLETFTYSGFYTVFASRMGTFMNGPAQIGPNHADAAASPSEPLLPVTGVVTPTTKCFKNILSDLGGTTVGANFNNATNGFATIPNQCFPRGASANRFPGSKKFGGTAKMLRRLDTVGTFVGNPSGLSQFSLQGVRTASLANQTSGTKTGIVGSSVWTNTAVGIQEQRMALGTSVALTTGMVTINGPLFGTQQTQTGSHVFNTANLTGMISMVRPGLAQGFARRLSDGVFVSGGPGFQAIARLELTLAGELVPEPGTAGMLAAGGLALAGLARRRRI